MTIFLLVQVLLGGMQALAALMWWQDGEAVPAGSWIQIGLAVWALVLLWGWA